MVQIHPSQTVTRLQSFTWGLLFAVLVTVVLKSLSFLFIPLSIALLICYALGIPFNWLQKYRLSRWLVIPFLLLSAVLLAFIFGRLIHANVVQFQTQLPNYEAQFHQYADAVFVRLSISPEQAREAMAAFLANIGQEDLKPLGSVLQQVSGSFFAFLGNLLWVLLFLMFLLAEQEGLARRLEHGLGAERSAPVLDAAGRINTAVQQYLGLKTLVSLLTGMLVSLVLWALGVHFALLWGLLTFFLNFVPNIGSMAATVPPVAVALFQTGSISRSLVVASLLVAIQLGVGNFVEPRLMGRGLNLSPLVVLLSLLFWGWMWGITGMLLAIPLTAATKIALEQLDGTRPLAILMGGE